MAARLGLKPAAAKTLLREVFTAVSAWRATGRKLRLKAATLEAYASALERTDCRLSLFRYARDSGSQFINVHSF